MWYVDFWIATSIGIVFSIAFFLFCLGFLIFEILDPKKVKPEDWIMSIGIGAFLIFLQLLTYLGAYVTTIEIDSDQYSWVVATGQENSAFAQRAQRFKNNDGIIDRTEYRWLVRHGEKPIQKITVEKKIENAKEQMDLEVK